jgi:hypothetical protein
MSIDGKLERKQGIKWESSMGVNMEQNFGKDQHIYRI